ncbi:MAG: hypothetical protein QOE90_3662 [Thermoplasmata archaeon]|jgi:hypothetical protein|nr:hypothetical protein [Thermoplasmata archaeon]
MLPLALVLAPQQALIAAIIVIVLVFLIWKFVKAAFKIALVVGIAILIYLALNALHVI